MKNRYGKRAPYLALGAVVIVAAIVCSMLFAASRHTAPPDDTYYADALKEASTSESVVVRNVPYTVTDGVVYRAGAVVPPSDASPALILAYEKAVAQRSPLIALPGTDPKRLDTAIQALQKTSIELGSLQKDPGTQALVESSLYPIGFLQKASALERARQAFIESGSDTDAAAYEKAGFAASQAFQSDLDRYRRGFIQAVPSNAPPYVMLQNYEDYATVLSIVAQLQSGMATTSKELAARSRCFSGISSACDPSDLLPPSLTVPTAPAPVSASVLSYANQSLSRPPLQEKLSGDDVAQEPYLEVSAPGCAEDASSPQLFLIHSEPFSGTTYEYPIMVTADRLVDADAQEAIPFFAYFADRGVKYVTSDPFVYYECVNYALDSGELLGMDAVRAYALEYPLEQALSSATHVITQYDTTLYASLEENAALDGSLPSKRRSKHLTSRSRYKTEAPRTTASFSASRRSSKRTCGSTKKDCR